jgi:hypothetical protein
MKAFDLNLVWCMGVTKLRVIENGLEFRVNGLSYKGLVHITLNAADLYDVSLVKSGKMIKDVFCEDLMPVLELEIENRQHPRKKQSQLHAMH